MLLSIVKLTLAIGTKNTISRTDDLNLSFLVPSLRYFTCQTLLSTTSQKWLAGWLVLLAEGGLEDGSRKQMVCIHMYVATM